MALLVFASLVSAEKVDSPWSKQTTPAPGDARSIGDYSAGCLQGAVKLPLHGDGYEVMHPSRLRYFGNPALIDFLKTLGKAVKKHGLDSLLIGDLSQPRGGRAPGGHASHQTGLDVDLWYVHPAGLHEPLQRSEREAQKAQTVLDADAHGVQKAEAARVAALLQLTAADARVERIFVHPLIKKELCEAASKQSESERAWLGKLRPWYGHDDHFHVRLACPKDSPDCTSQEARPAGDGCSELDYWLSDEKRAERERGQREYQSKVVTPRAVPVQCAEVLIAK
ncbi:MAG TPA: penicillin-insensitive murein endopeptidase [Polyangiales bacterium]|nr:penicillin-insensitive murein endopeptidase [Polyangiales bacterium]